MKKHTVEKITQHANSTLEDFGLRLLPHHVSHLIPTQNVSTCTEQELQQLASDLSAEILFEFAEECPGTDPWLDHVPRIPLTMHFMSGVMAMLSNLTEIMYILGEECSLYMEELAKLLAWYSTAQNTMTSNPETGGYTILVPQPGLARIRRIFQGLIEYAHDNDWVSIPDTGGGEWLNVLEYMVAHIQQQADEYGTSRNPSLWS